ncbi:MAG: Rab family GTPase [Promethearchaeota archaeon]
MSTFDFKFKIVLLGDAAVGKTSLVKRFTDNLADFKAGDMKVTMGCEISNVPVWVSKTKRTLLNIWDLGGGSRFIDIRTTFLRGAVGYLLVFDITRPETFEHCEDWRREIAEVTGRPDLPCNLLANKDDLQEFRAIRYKDVKEYASKHCMTFYRTSAIRRSPEDAKVVNKSFTWLARKIFKGLRAEGRCD